MSDELKPCPFCGSDNVDTEVVAPHTHKVATFMPDYHGGAMACCYDCSAAIWRDGPDAHERAVDFWNRRAEQNKGAQTREQAACDKVLAVVRAYLPPGGLSKDEFIGRVIEAVDGPEFNAKLDREPQR